MLNEEALEQLQQKHRKEKKDLQAKIQALKKSVAKNDKKRKKEIVEEVQKLEEKMAQDHEAELVALQGKKKETTNGNGLDGLIEAVEDGFVINDEKRVSKAQRRRARKDTHLKERELRILEQDAENLNGARHLETEAIKNLLKERGLMIQEVPSDGNCLYNAVLKRIKDLEGTSVTVTELRCSVAAFLRQNKDEFLPYLSHPDTGSMLTDDQYEEYCDQVANTTAWGGEVELRAISHVLKRPVEVIQAKGPAVIAGTEYDGRAPTVVLTYHRHMYGLGEHYNSVMEYKEEKDDF